MKATFFGAGLPAYKDTRLKGRLIVLEGPDCVGRSTQMRLLQDWLERVGYGVVTTSLCRSELAAKGLGKAKGRNQVGRRTLALFYATDLADRLERQILPALEGGFIVLADRYVYTIFARNAVRGISPDWLRKAYGFALVPHLTMYLDVDIDTLAHRALEAGKMGFWECGMDMNLADDLYESFITYQKRMLRQFSRMVKEFKLIKVDARAQAITVHRRLQRKVQALLDVKETEPDEDEAPQPVPEAAQT